MADADGSASEEADTLPAGERVPAFGFRSEGMSQEENVSAWTQAVATMFDIDELARGEPEPFRADVATYVLGPVILGITRASGQRFRRTLDTIARSGVDHVLIQLYTHGGYDGVVGTRAVRVRTGDICVLDLAQTLETRATAHGTLTLVLPRPKLEACLSRPESLHGLVLPTGDVMGTLVGRHLQALAELAPSMTVADCAAVVAGSVPLIAACLKARLERDDAVAGPPTDSQLIRVKQYIEVRLGEAELSSTSIAAGCGLSRATLYRLFTPFGGVAAYVRSRRLHRAFFDLAEPEARVKSVARRWHLGTEASFTRAFKAAYGITPTAARSPTPASARTDEGDGPSKFSRWMRNLAPPSRG